MLNFCNNAEKVTALINFENVYVNYGMTTVLENVNLKINEHENWVILGANGSGKSTLMKLFSHDLYPNTKYPFKKEIFGKDRWDIFELKKYLGIITNDLHNQFANHSGAETAYDVVLSGYHSSLGVFKHHDFTEKQYEKALSALEFLDILDIKDKKVSQMSTGQLRRCVIGRALVHEPKAFILDEPTTGLDIKARSSFIKVLRKLSRKTPIILITHDIEEVFPEITHVALMYNKTTFKQGRKEEVLTSENLSEIFEINVNLQNENDIYKITEVLQ